MASDFATRENVAAPFLTTLSIHVSGKPVTRPSESSDDGVTTWKLNEPSA